MRYILTYTCKVGSKVNIVVVIRHYAPVSAKKKAVIALNCKGLSLHPYRKGNKNPILPSFLTKPREAKQNQNPGRTYTYDRDIICLPCECLNKEGLVKIPRRKGVREYLASNRLIGKVRLSSAMSEDEIMSEIRSVFSVPEDRDRLFRF